MRRRFWRHVAKFAAKRAGLRVVASVNVGPRVIWPTIMTSSTASPGATVTYKL